MPRIHLKRLETDRLALCDIWPGTNWVLKELAAPQATGTVCKICSIVAGKLILTEAAKSNQPMPGKK